MYYVRDVCAYVKYASCVCVLKVKQLNVTWRNS